MKKLLILILVLLCLFGLSACELETTKETPHTHTYSRAAITTAPTCTENGVITFYCACGATYNSVFQATGHNYQAETAAPTCTEQGYTTYSCKVCDDTYVSDYVDELGHTPAAAIEENRIEPTCTETGGYDSVIYCAVCGAEMSRETVILDVSPHDFKIDTTTIQKVDNLIYEFNIVCDCGKVLHVNAGKSKTVVPTCCEQGYNEYVYYYRAENEIASGTVNLEFTEPTPHLHALGYDEDGEPLQFEAYGLSDDNKTYVITPLIQEFLDSGELKLNGGHMTGNTELATFDCVHCHKLIVIRLEREND